MAKADDTGRWEMCPAQAGWFHSWKREQYGKVTPCHRKPLPGHVQGSGIIWRIFQKALWILGRKGAPEGGTVMKAKRKWASGSWVPCVTANRMRSGLTEDAFANRFSWIPQQDFQGAGHRVWWRKTVWASEQLLGVSHGSAETSAHPFDPLLGGSQTIASSPRILFLERVSLQRDLVQFLFAQLFSVSSTNRHDPWSGNVLSCSLF